MSDRQRKLKERKRHQNQRQRKKPPRVANRSTTVRFEFSVEKGTSPEVLDALRRAISKLDLTDRTRFPTPFPLLFGILLNQGAKAYYSAIDSIPTTEFEGVLAQMHLHSRIGQTILDDLTQGEREQFFPYNDFTVIATDHHFVIYVRSLQKVRLNNQWYYHSRRAPRVLIDGVPRIVCFTKHAIERTCERVRPDWATYYNMADVYAFFANCVYFEPAQLRDDQPAFTFWNDCTFEVYHPKALNVLNEYALRVMGMDTLALFADRGIHWYYRVGYCPVAIHGDYACAITLLFPGFRQTPEFNIIRELRNPQEREEKARIAKDLTCKYLSETFDFSLIKWFHDNGVEQVIPMAGNVFASSSLGTSPIPVLRLKYGWKGKGELRRIWVEDPASDGKDAAPAI